MRQKAELTDQIEQLEHIIMQLEGETETIGECKRVLSSFKATLLPFTCSLLHKPARDTTDQDNRRVKTVSFEPPHLLARHSHFPCPCLIIKQAQWRDRHYW